MYLIPIVALIAQAHTPQQTAQQTYDVANADGSVGLDLSGQYSVNALGVTDMRVDADGRLYGQKELWTQRLRFAPVLHLHKAVEIESELQLAAGFLSWDKPLRRFRSAEGEGSEINYGPPRSADGDAFDDFQDQLQLRKLSMTWHTVFGQLRLGRMASQWGLGVLANSGDNETQDWGGPRFGQDRNYGDIVDRVLFATAPLIFLSDTKWAQRWILAVGGDVVARDERTVRAEGDWALEAIGALRYQHRRNTLGMYIAHRDLQDRNDDTLKVTAYDAFGEGRWHLGDLDVIAAGELAWVLGDTTLARNNAFTGNIKVQQLGYVARLGAQHPAWHLGGDVELGYASGDSNSNDGFLRNFTFDPDYNPSLILFEELRAAETVASAANASDPEKVGYPPDAARLIPTNGAVTNAIYVRPTLRVLDLAGLQGRIAALWARAEEDIFDPYNSNALGGGTALNYQGGNGNERDLGWEFDLGLDYTYRWDTWVDATFGAQAGYFLPGKAFADAEGVLPDPVGVIYGRMVLRWLPSAS